MDTNKIILSKSLLRKYGFMRTLVLMTVGLDGFTGSIKDLALKTEFVSVDYMKNLICAMEREGLINRDYLRRGIYYFYRTERNKI